MKSLEILEYLDKHSNACMDDDFCEENFWSYIDKSIIEDCDAEVNYGATKLVFSFKDTDFVIKIPFFGSYEEEYCSDESDNEDEYNEYYGYCFKEFSGAPLDNDWNYCAAESEIYKLAKEEGIEDLFAKTEFLGRVNDLFVYTQEKAEMFDYCKTTLSKEDSISIQKKMKDISSPIRSEVWVYDFINYYNEELFDELCAFLNKYEINDMHSGNIGYIEDRPVLVDYSAFHS